jgi:S-DNA-T family DNA segregation ATPase FtsK/SpoIIIE
MKTNGYRVEELLSDGLTSRQRWVIPLWMSMLGLTCKGIGRAVAWWARRSAVTFPLTVLTVLYFAYGWRALASLAAGFGAILAGWAWLHRPSFLRLVAHPALGQWRLVIRYRRLWRAGMVGGRLAVRDGNREWLPVIRRARSTRWADTLTVRLLHRRPSSLRLSPRTCGTCSARTGAPRASCGPAGWCCASSGATRSPTYCRRSQPGRTRS